MTQTTYILHYFRKFIFLKEKILENFFEYFFIADKIIIIINLLEFSDQNSHIKAKTKYESL